MEEEHRGGLHVFDVCMLFSVPLDYFSSGDVTGQRRATNLDPCSALVVNEQREFI